jgi:catalase
MLFSDYGTPKGWIHMSGYGCHTFAMVNAEGDRHFIKWHWRCQYVSFLSSAFAFVAEP